MARLYDIYHVPDVERLKRDYAELMARYRAEVRENARLNEELDRRRRAAAMEGART